MVSSSDTLCTYILYRKQKKSIDILSKNEDFAHKHQLFHGIVQKDLKCIVRYDFSIYFLQSKLVQIRQSLCNIGFAYFIFIEAAAAAH